MESGTFVAQMAARYAFYEDRRDVDHRNLSLVTSLSWQATASLNLSISVPYHSYETEADGAGADSLEAGVGDLTIAGIWAPWAGEDDREKLFDPRRLAFLVGLRLPTGEGDLDRFAGVGGEIVPLGSGTTDLLLGGVYRTNLGAGLRAFDALVFSVPLEENDDEPPPGTFLGTKDAFSVFNRAGIAYGVGEAVDVHLALDLLWKGEADGTVVSRDDGGTFLWMTPGATVSLGSGFSLDGSIQIPLGNGHPTASVGLSFRF